MDTLTLARVALSELHTDSANVRLHDERNLDAIRGSLARFGQHEPIVVDRTGVIRAGDGAYLAAKALNAMLDEVIAAGQSLDRIVEDGAPALPQRHCRRPVVVQRHHAEARSSPRSRPRSPSGQGQADAR